MKENSQFLVKWQGYLEHDNTWEPLDYLKKCEEAIKEFRIRNVRVNRTKRTLDERKNF